VKAPGDHGIPGREASGSNSARSKLLVQGPVVGGSVGAGWPRSRSERSLMAPEPTLRSVHWVSDPWGMAGKPQPRLPNHFTLRLAPALGYAVDVAVRLRCFIRARQPCELRDVVHAGGAEPLFGKSWKRGNNPLLGT
jgi:hypothetical protein